MNITEILGLIDAERWGDNNRYNTASQDQSACHNYSLEGSSSCFDDIDAITLYVDIPAFDPTEYIRTERGTETGESEEIITWRKVEPLVRFSIYGNTALVNLLNQLALHEQIVFTNIPDSVGAIVKSMEVAASPVLDHMRIDISLTFADSSIITSLCCGSYYENAPFNECDGEGETGDPSNDPECTDYEVSISLVAGPPDELSASSTGGGAGSETFTWYKDGILFGTGATVQVTIPGTYRVDAVKGSCLSSTSYTYSGDCGGFEVGIVEVDIETGVILIATPNLTSTVQWQVFNDPTWEDVAGETDIYFEPIEDGTYRAVATAGECEAESDSVVVELPVDCDGLFTVEVTNESGTLTSEISDYEGEGTPTYQWYRDTGNGIELVADATEATFADASPGYYTVFVTLDDCVVVASILVQCTFDEIEVGCGCGDTSLWNEDFTGTGSEVSFAITNFYLPDPAMINSNAIASTFLVLRNGVAMMFVAGAPANGTEYSIDYATQAVTINAGFPLLEGETLVVRKLKCLEL